MTDESVSMEMGNADAMADAGQYDGGHDAGAYETHPAQGGGWTQELGDAEARAFAEAKGWRGPADMLGSYRNLEKLLGSEKLPLPRDDSDAEGHERVYKALGRPDTPDGYRLQVPAGGDQAFAGEASKWFHEAGLSGRQANALAERFNAHVGQVEAAAQQQYAARSQQDADELRAEWGERFEANVEMGRRAARQFGLEGGEVAAMERALGTRKLLTVLSKIGRGLGEDSFEGGDRPNAFRMSPEAARGRIEALKADKAWGARFLSGGADEKAEWNRLQRLANP